jgi:hypothetical protein
VPRYLWRAIADNGVEGPRTALRSGCFPRLAEVQEPVGACSEAGDGRELRTVKTNHGALVSNFHNGVPRSYRDRKDIALQSTAVSKVLESQQRGEAERLADRRGDRAGDSVYGAGGCSALHHPDKCRCYVAGSKVAGGSQDPRRMFRCGDKSARHDGTFSPADFVSVIDDVPLIDVAGAGVRPRHLCNTARIPTRCVQGRNRHPAQALAR